MTDVTLTRWSKAPYVFVDGELPQELINALDTEMSYFVEDADRTDAFKRGDWDGMEHLFRESSNGSYYFPAGLLTRACRVIESFGFEVNVEGVERPGRGSLSPAWDTDMQLREYQQEAVQTALRRGNGVITMPTGAGKTLIGIRLAYEIKRPTMVLVHRQEIADQWVGQMQSILDVDVARYYGGDRETGDYQVALYQSVLEDGEVRDDARLDHEVLLADECHRVGADTFSQVTLDTGASYRYGMSATPERDDNATLKVIGGVGELIADITPESLIDDGYLAEPDWRIIDAPKSGGHYRDWNEEYRGEIVTNERRNQRIAEEARALPHPCYIHVERIDHGDVLAALIDDAEFVHSGTSDRDEIIESFRFGDQPVLISTLLGEGFDVPSLRSLIMAGGLKAEIGSIQKVGRALRPDTDEATIVDFIDNGRHVGDHSEQRLRIYREYYGEYGP